MRRGRIVIGAALILSAVSLAGAPSAFAASPQDICADLADGTVNGTYTNAEWTAFFTDPTIQGYGCGGIVTPGTQPTQPTQPGTQPGTQPAGGAVPVTIAGTQGAQNTAGTPVAGVAGTQKTVSAAGTPLATTTTARGTLPFTGAQLALFAVVGLALLGTGLLLRSTARPKPTHRL
jgi:hypothetical protein